MSKIIEKPWCICRGEIGSPICLGLIEEISQSGTLWIRYSEGQHYSLEPWDPAYVDRFNDFTEVIKIMARSHEVSYDKEINYFYQSFPSMEPVI